MSDPRYSTYKWKVLRKAIRARDRNVCQLRLPGCRGAATQVDHRVEPGPPELGRDDLFFDATNLRASCRPCNISKRNSRTADLARQAQGLPAKQTQPDPSWAHYGGDAIGGYFRTSREW